MLGFGPDDIDSAMATFRELCQIAVEDGMAVDPTSVKGAVIRQEAGYGGVQVDLQAKLDGARIALQVDIGFRDAVTPAPAAVSCPLSAARCYWTACPPRNCALNQNTLWSPRSFMPFDDWE